MTPHNHYPRVDLEYCRCGQCGNTLRSMMRSRIFAKRSKNMPYTPIPRYKLKRKIRWLPKQSIASKSRRPYPPYKKRRLYQIQMRELMKQYGPNNEELQSNQVI